MWQKSTCTWAYCTAPSSFLRCPRLKDDLLLVVEHLLRDGVARPRGAVPREVHLCLREDVLIAHERALRLQERRHERARVDVDQRVPLFTRCPSW